MAEQKYIELIDRQAAIDAIDRAVTKEAARWSLQELPSAERRGRWTTERTMEHDGEWYCSVCGYEPTVYEASNYCPNCGAKMEGEQNE